jgi:hypothetical protein
MSKLDQIKALGDAKRAARNSSGRSLAGGATSDLARVGKGVSQTAEQRPSKTVQDTGSVSVDRMQEAPERQAPRQEKGSTPLESTKSRGGKVKLQVREKVSRDHGSPARGNTGEGQSATSALVATQSKRSRGRPKIEGPREWERQGISRTTYYRDRRKKEQGK